jgi:ketosteroid isomerase-like protein
MRGWGISRVLMVAVAVLASTLAYGQDPQDQTPSAPARPAQGSPGAQGQRPMRGGGGGPQATLPQMPMNGGDVNRDQIIGQERAELEALKSGDVATVGAALTDDAVFVDANGILRKPELLKLLGDVKLTDYAMSDVRFVAVSPDNGVVSYTLTESGTRQGQAFSAKVFVSSAWVRNGRGFQCVFSQETPAK